MLAVRDPDMKLLIVGLLMNDLVRLLKVLFSGAEKLKANGLDASALSREDDARRDGSSKDDPKKLREELMIHRTLDNDRLQTMT